MLVHSVLESTLRSIRNAPTSTLSHALFVVTAYYSAMANSYTCVMGGSERNLDRPCFKYIGGSYKLFEAMNLCDYHGLPKPVDSTSFGLIGDYVR